MKLKKLSNIFALCLTGLMALTLIGCTQNSDDSHKKIPSGYEGGDLGGGSDSGGGSESGGSTSSSSTAITNTTWFYLKAGSDKASCTRSHYVAPSNPYGGSGYDDPYGGSGSGSGSGSGNSEPTITSESTIDQSKNGYNEKITAYYLHVDKSNNAFFGVAEWTETYTETWKEKVTNWSNNTQTKEEVDGSRKRDVTATSAKSYKPYAMGTAKDSSGKIEFDFPYLNTIINQQNDTSSSSSSYDDYYDDYPTNPSGSGSSNQTNTTEFNVIPDMFLSIYVNNQNDGLHVTHLLNDNYTDKGQSASKKGKNLRLEYLVKEHSCGDKAPDGTPCPTQLIDKYYTLWEPATYDEAMLTANLIPVEDCLKDKVFTNSNDWVVDETYDYFGFYEKGSVKETAAIDYWGSGIFCANKTIKGKEKNTYYAVTNDDPWVVSEKNGKYYLKIKGDGTVYYFDEPAQGSSQDYAKFYYKDYTDAKVCYYMIEGAIGKEYLLYNTEYFIGNKFKYKKGYVSDKEWYRQAATWKDDKGNAIECSSCSEEKYGSKEGQAYKVKLDNKEYDVIEVGDCGIDKYGVRFDGGAVSLTDKKDGTIIIKYNDSSYTLSYDSRFGYDENDFVWVDLSFEKEPEINPEAAFYYYEGYSLNDFDDDGSKYNLPKTMKVSELVSFCLPEEKKYFSNNAYKAKGGDLVAADKTMEELGTPRTLYLVHEKDATAITVDLEYDGSNYYLGGKEGYEYTYTSYLYTVTITIVLDSSLKGSDLLTFIQPRASAGDSSLKITYGDGSKTIEPSQTLKDAGIKDGDKITFVEPPVEYGY